MAAHNQLGNTGESIARGYLISQGYELLHTNWRVGHLEVDIIARQNETIHIVEVKTRTRQHNNEQNDFSPEKALTPQKMNNLILAAEQFITQNDSKAELSIDLIAIDAAPDGCYEIKHYPAIHLEYAY